MILLRSGTPDAVRPLVRASGLPADDLAPDAHVRVAEADGAVVGCVAVEAYGTAGLLRSLAVAPAHRGEGLGRRLVEAAEAVARDLDLEALVLLTTTAAPFFESLGYVRTDRQAVPDAVRASSEFTSTCPASATCLSRSFGEVGIEVGEIDTRGR